MEGEDLMQEADQGVEGRTRMLGAEGGGAGLVKGRKKLTNSWR